MNEWPEEYWIIDLAGGIRITVHDTEFPEQLRPHHKEPLDLSQMVWLTDISGGPIGFVLDAVNCVIWTTPEIRRYYAEWQKTLDAQDPDPKQPWE